MRTLEHIHVPPTSEVLVPTRIFQNKAINLALIQPTQSKSASTSSYMVATTLAYIENGFDHMKIIMRKPFIFTQRIETGHAMPIRQRLYRAYPKTEAEINKQIEEMSYMLYVSI